ncbi:winged helix domain-containing protein [Xanthobacter pseudotagetidis]|uniref:winged helix domain-containing protein n=1 Tax=Xanthobacter pseudotagetidis TaxID=3119911 RepID=UPI00372B3306
MVDVTRLTFQIDAEGPQLTVKGRMAWALHELVHAGERGCTPIERPAPRWSDYIFKLRKAGLAIDTVDEAHGGAYSGSHGRYVPRSPVLVIEEVRR